MSARWSRELAENSHMHQVLHLSDNRMRLRSLDVGSQATATVVAMVVHLEFETVPGQEETPQKMEIKLPKRER